jgi:hypothetical protein
MSKLQNKIKRVSQRKGQTIILLAIGHMVIYEFLPDIDNMAE